MKPIVFLVQCKTGKVYKLSAYNDREKKNMLTTLEKYEDIIAIFYLHYH